MANVLASKLFTSLNTVVGEDFNPGSALVSRYFSGGTLIPRCLHYHDCHD